MEEGLGQEDSRRHYLISHGWSKENQISSSVESYRNGNRNGFCKQINSDRKSRKNVGLSQNRAENMVTKDTENLNCSVAFFFPNLHFY